MRSMRPRTSRSSSDSIHCYICKQHFTDDPSFLRSDVPDVRGVQLREAHGARRSARTRRAAHRRPRQDRLSGGAQAAARRRATHRHHALPARLRRALCAGAGLRASGATASRSSGSTCGTRRASRRSARAAGHARPARLHHQQRVPDRSPSAGFLRAHDGGRDAPRCASCRSTCASCSAAYEGLRGYHMLPEADGNALAPRRSMRRTLRGRGPHARGGAVADRAAARGAARRRSISSPKGGSIRICSRWICAGATRGGC